MPASCPKSRLARDRRWLLWPRSAHLPLPALEFEASEVLGSFACQGSSRKTLLASLQRLLT